MPMEGDSLRIAEAISIECSFEKCISIKSTLGCILRINKIADVFFCASPITFVPCSLSAAPKVVSSKRSSITNKTRSLIP